MDGPMAAGSHGVGFRNTTDRRAEPKCLMVCDDEHS